MRQQTLYQWFSSSAQKFPQAVALEVSGLLLTYRELERRALATAARILEIHGRPPARVALVSGRTAAAFVGYLAIQRIGASVIPLDPKHPVHRNLDIGQQAGIDVALVNPNANDPFQQLPPRFRPTIVTITDAGPDESTDIGPLVPDLSDDLSAEAYLLFTSGTQGRPKGVPIQQRNISHCIAHNLQAFEVDAQCRLSQAFGLTFDASVVDLFMAWGAGATLVVPSLPELLHPVDFIERNQLTHWFSVPSVVRVAQRLGNLPLGRATTLRHSMFGGEPVTLDHARLWRSVAPNSTIHNLYGPTEMTVNCTQYRLPADVSAWSAAGNGTLPIGAPSAGLETMILDSEGHVGDDGEFCLRGPQRFDGYLETHENIGRFVKVVPGYPAQPYTGSSPLTPEHWYRTGDRVSREGPHANLVHRGRLDQQVQITGHRVETGEVEAALRRHPQIADAAVIALPISGETHLVAVYASPTVAAVELENWLRRELPDYMVPSRFERRPSLPLNDNGKVDRRQLLDLLTEEVRESGTQGTAGRGPGWAGRSPTSS